MAFLCVKRIREGQETITAMCTGFWVSITEDDVGYHYVLTAKHCIRKAEQLSGYEGLFLRVNARGGGTVVMPVRNCYFSDNEGSDAAVLEVGGWTEQPDYTVIQDSMFVTDELSSAHNLGCGDDLLITGLFVGHRGKDRILPVIRFGTIAAMPEEPLNDENTGSPYDAYLAEVRSIGGLSGSPVFVLIEKPFDPKLAQRQSKIFNPFRYVVLLIGAIRGHHDVGDAHTWNSGITFVTPSQDFLRILMKPELVRGRRERSNMTKDLIGRQILDARQNPADLAGE